MPKPTVYLETTVLSLLTGRPTRDLIVAAMQNVTRDWWENRRLGFEVFISDFGVDEAKRGDPRAARRRLALAGELPRLVITPEVRLLADRLMSEVPLPPNAQQDSLHIACAAVHHMDYLLSWNCTHIANAEFVPTIRAVCSLTGYECPQICTPQELLGLRP